MDKKPWFSVLVLSPRTGFMNLSTIPILPLLCLVIIFIAPMPVWGNRWVGCILYLKQDLTYMTFRRCRRKKCVAEQRLASTSLRCLARHPPRPRSQEEGNSLTDPAVCTAQRAPGWGMQTSACSPPSGALYTSHNIGQFLTLFCFPFVTQTAWNP